MDSLHCHRLRHRLGVVLVARDERRLSAEFSAMRVGVEKIK